MERLLTSIAEMLAGFFTGFTPPFFMVVTDDNGNKKLKRNDTRLFEMLLLIIAFLVINYMNQEKITQKLDHLRETFTMEISYVRKDVDKNTLAIDKIETRLDNVGGRRSGDRL